VPRAATHRARGPPRYRQRPADRGAGSWPSAGWERLPRPVTGPRSGSPCRSTARGGPARTVPQATSPASTAVTARARRLRGGEPAAADRENVAAQTLAAKGEPPGAAGSRPLSQALAAAWCPGRGSSNRLPAPGPAHGGAAVDLLTRPLVSNLGNRSPDPPRFGPCAGHPPCGFSTVSATCRGGPVGPRGHQRSAGSSTCACGTGHAPVQASPAAGPVRPMPTRAALSDITSLGGRE